MKKLCTRCGSQLSLTERQCTSCGAFNPFYMTSLRRQSIANAEMEVLEEQLLATETVQATGNQALIGQSEIQSIVQEAETGLKQEILKVKDETEQYKRQTFELVKEVRQELQHIDEENRRLKQEVEMLSQTRIEQATTAGETSAASSRPITKRVLTATAVLAIAFCLGLGYFLMQRGDSAAPEAPQSKTTAIPAGQSAPQAEIKTVVPVESSPAPEKPDPKKIMTTATPAVVHPVKSNSTAEPVVNKNDKPLKPAAAITETKLRGDLIGSKLSGCGITINYPAEIMSLGSLRQIETETPDMAKYKFTLKVVQKGTIYYATPYAYYNTNGVLVRIDGTNCE